MFVGNDVDTLITTFFGNFYMVKSLSAQLSGRIYIQICVRSSGKIPYFELLFRFFLYKNRRNRFTIFSKVFHTFITFVSYIINCRKHQVFLNLIFFFFIRAGAKAPASFHFWGKYPVYRVNCESRIRKNEIKVYL